MDWNYKVLLTMIVRGEPYIMILKISQTMPTIRDLFFVPCNAVSDIAAMARKKTTSNPSPKATFFCKIQRQKAH